MAIKLGSPPTERYYLSWITQRMANAAPEDSKARKSQVSYLKQILNPMAQEIEKNTHELLEEVDNMHLSTANVLQLESLYKINVSPQLELPSSVSGNNTKTWKIPKVFAEINNIEYEITQAHKNNIETLSYNSIPSRIEDAYDSHSYEPVVATNTNIGLSGIAPKQPSIEGHLYITLSNNSNWSVVLGDKRYFSKIYITGITRKGIRQTEVLPLRYNGTFRTVNQWKFIEEIYTSYLNEDAEIAVDVFPWMSDGILDSRNLYIDIDGEEKYKFLNLGTHTWGSTITSQSFTTNNFDVIRGGLDAKDTIYELELLDEFGGNISATAFTMRPYSEWAFVIANKKLYVYDINLPYPDLSKTWDETPDSRIELHTDRWIYARDEQASIRTRLHDFLNVPSRYKWSVITPSGQEYGIDADNKFIPLELSKWVNNPLQSNGKWKDSSIDITLSERGTYTFLFTYTILNEGEHSEKTFKVRTILFVPSIKPEIALRLPSTITDIKDLSFDSDGRLWVLNTYELKRLNLFYDYFIVDYENSIIWMREFYNSVRVELDV